MVDGARIPAGCNQVVAIQGKWSSTAQSLSSGGCKMQVRPWLVPLFLSVPAVPKPLHLNCVHLARALISNCQLDFSLPSFDCRLMWTWERKYCQPASCFLLYCPTEPRGPSQERPPYVSSHSTCLSATKKSPDISLVSKLRFDTCPAALDPEGLKLPRYVHHGGSKSSAPIPLR